MPMPLPQHPKRAVIRTSTLIVAMIAALTALPAQSASAQPYCDVPEPPPICRGDRPTPPKPRPVTLLPLDQPRQVSVALHNVRAFDTEDTGALDLFGNHDELYFYGAARLGTNSMPIATAPKSIGPYQSYKPWGQPSASAILTGHDTVALAVKAMEEDAGKDWEDIAPIARKVAKTVIDQMTSSDDAFVAAAGVIFAVCFTAGDYLTTADADDYLGKIERDIALSGLPAGKHFYDADISGERLRGLAKWSDWHYSVTYTVTVKPL